MQNYNLTDLFWSVQGEGFNSGTRALFVRLPNCNLKCSWCDTDWTVFKTYTEEQFRQFIQLEKAPICVITGGEPLHSPQINDIIKIVKQYNFKTTCETNGTMPYVEGIDWVTCSPKRETGYLVHPNIAAKVNEFKYVVDKDFDFSVLERHDTKDGKHYYLSPEFGNFRESIKEILRYQRKNSDWKLSLQTHKWIRVK
jgi:organic radical activating enzyme